MGRECHCAREMNGGEFLCVAGGGDELSLAFGESSRIMGFELPKKRGFQRFAVIKAFLL